MSRPAAQLQLVSGAGSQSHTSLAHLIHALNQPLTGLQCSMELAVAGPRRADQYVRTLREGLELTHRIRILVEAIRELSERQQREPGAAVPVQLAALLRNTVEELLPVAEALGVRIALTSNEELLVSIDHDCAAALTFRLLETVLSLAQRESELRIMATVERAQARLVVSWIPGPPPEHSPFSSQELGLLIVQTKWEQAGAEWHGNRVETRQTCTIRLPMASSLADANRVDWEI